mgnify:CR=1 FL=1
MRRALNRFYLRVFQGSSIIQGRIIMSVKLRINAANSIGKIESEVQ